SRSMDVEFVKGKIATINEKENGDLVLKYEDIREGTIKEATHDLVVLSVGMLANPEAGDLFMNNTLEIDEFGFVKQVDMLKNPASTSIEGVFVAGTASGPMDIPDSIASSGGAATEALSYLKRKS
ncbi:MAG: hypothetical protein KOO63_12910, partial [Bacteroidales bacterium]|nr:hypothetical protein [Candidatus Latescibacterota bacterium]